jgi:hypothetical protein
MASGLAEITSIMSIQNEYVILRRRNSVNEITSLKINYESRNVETHQS